MHSPARIRDVRVRPFAGRTVAHDGVLWPFLRLHHAGTKKRRGRECPPEARGRAFGIFYFVTSLAALLSSILTGELWKHYGAEFPFLLSAALAAVSAVLVLITPRLRNQEMIDSQISN